MAKYLLPCDCGRSARIETSQAGQTVVCECGKDLEVPTLRAIRLLEQDEQAPAMVGQPRWNVTYGVFFATACLLILMGGVLGGLSHRQWLLEKAHIPPLPTPEEADAWIAQVDDMSQLELWEEWNALKGLSFPPISARVIWERHAARVLQRTLMLYGVAGVGLLISVVTIIMGARRRKP